MWPEIRTMWKPNVTEAGLTMQGTLASSVNQQTSVSITRYLPTLGYGQIQNRVKEGIYSWQRFTKLAVLLTPYSPVFPVLTTHLVSIRLLSCSNRCSNLSRLPRRPPFWLPVIHYEGETNQQLSHFLFRWPSSWHLLSYSNRVKAFSKQCCPLDTKKVSAHMLNLLLLGILPHREPVKSFWAHLYLCCWLGESHQDFIFEQDLLWEAKIENTALNLTLMCINKQIH